MRSFCTKLCCSGVLAALGCAGPGAPVPQPVVLPAPPAPQASQAPTQRAVQAPKPTAAAVPAGGAADRFAQFSKEIDNLKQDEPTDPAHLRQELLAMVALDPQFLPARFNLAILLERDGQADEAHKQMGLMLQQDPHFVPARENLAAQAVRMGDVAAAAAVYQEIIAQSPTNTVSRLALARLYNAQGKYDEAIVLCRQVLQRQADAKEAFRILGRSYLALGQLPMAELVIGRGLRMAKQDVELQLLTAQLALAEGNLSLAIKKLKQVIVLDGSCLPARAMLANLQLQHRDFGNAAQQYEAILQAQPDLTSAKNNLAVSYKAMGQIEQADKLYQQILSKDAHDMYALFNRAILAHRNLGHYDEAIAAYRQLAALPAGQLDEAVAKRLAQVEALIAEAEKLKSDQATQKAQQAHAQQQKQAIADACAALRAAKPVPAEAIGSHQERIEAAWQLLATAQKSVEGGDVGAGEQTVQCAFALLPQTPSANASACAPMHVMWTQVLYRAGRLDAAQASIQGALACDPNNPDANLIVTQLKELRQKADAAQGQPKSEQP